MSPTSKPEGSRCTVAPDPDAGNRWSEMMVDVEQSIPPFGPIFAIAVPSAQLGVSPSCADGTAIAKIGPNGGIDCSTSTIISLHRFPASGSGATVHLLPSGLEVGLICHVPNVGFYFAV